MLEDLHFALRMLALSQALLFAALLVLSRQSGLFQPDRVATLTSVSVLAFSAYLILPFTGAAPVALGVTLEIVATMIPSLLWLNALWFFEDRRTVPYWLVPLTVFYVGTWLMPSSVQSQLIPPGDLHDVFFSLLPQLIKLGFVLHVIYMALAGRSRDLVDLRMELRAPFAMGAGVLASLVIVVEIWASGPVGLWLDVAGSTVMFAISFAANVSLVRAGLATRTVTTAAEESRRPFAQNGKTEAEDLTPIRQAMADRFYANHGAKLDDLAELLDIPAYRLRRLINQQLGYRNFNQFLNDYRIQEAATRLREESSPILTIALDVGFKSLSSFNAAFRAAHEMTPSAWRAGQKTEDGANEC